MDNAAIAEEKIQELIEEANQSGDFKNLASDITTVIGRYFNTSDPVLFLTDCFFNADFYQFIPEVVMYMLALHPAGENYLDTLSSLADECMICDSEDDTPVTLYRGSNNNSYSIENAFSFTSDRSIAEKFARGEFVADRSLAGKPVSDCKVYTVQVPKRFIIGQTDDRSEKEVMILPVAAGGKMDILQVENLD